LKEHCSCYSNYFLNYLKYFYIFFGCLHHLEWIHCLFITFLCLSAHLLHFLILDFDACSSHCHYYSVSLNYSHRYLPVDFHSANCHFPEHSHSHCRYCCFSSFSLYFPLSDHWTAYYYSHQYYFLFLLLFDLLLPNNSTHLLYSPLSNHPLSSTFTTLLLNPIHSYSHPFILPH